MATKVKTTSWSEIRARRPSAAASEAAADEARITAFRELVYQLRHEDKDRVLGAQAEQREHLGIAR